MFFKPQWYKMLTDSVKPISEDVIEKVEEFRKKSEGALSTEKTHEMIFMGIMVSMWAVKRIQKYTLELIRKQMPNASEKELWKQVLIARLNVKLNTSGRKSDIFSKPLSEMELLSRISSADDIIARFKSFNDVVDYVIKIDEEENRFYDPTGMQFELNNLLEPTLSEKIKNVTVEKLVDILVGQWGLTQSDLSDSFFKGFEKCQDTEEILLNKYKMENEIRILYLYVILFSIKMTFGKKESDDIFKMFRDNFFLKIEKRLGDKSFSEKWFSRRDAYTNVINSSSREEKFFAIGSKFAELCNLKNNKNIVEFTAVFFVEVLKKNLELLKSYRIIEDNVTLPNR
ncbi:MAG: hypothetical protein AUJ85_06900 [Elusimicrobia bacterium CG1_02_37_114]|nr:MAG: hypothetical protein AUJ85_06900 [Elusimicrobia bacterium CG1_02_37_114]PIV52520.1 MAG: hypothetical protein COS17_08750 [Elusimicrobia bacterium CG02_land_8_20_14_3_00_37_13]PIZ13763.1 MAG: hypothetical protein COY53_03110 [Elusimicrobia bacterium CG_4_10_14_0_8_um_filter_37_32]